MFEGYAIVQKQTAQSRLVEASFLILSAGLQWAQEKTNVLIVGEARGCGRL
jgi:hypothetical protein